MFTGIIEEIGTIQQIKKGQSSAILTIQASKVLEQTKVGDSIAVNGICLTVTALSEGYFLADVMHETLNRSSLAQMKRGSRVNLERAMAADGRFGGHIVAGHVDGVGRIVRTSRDDTAVWYTIEAEPAVLKYIVEKGSVTVDGISLTVARVWADSFSVSVIPHTQQQTILKERTIGDIVNLETDIIGKYVEKLMQPAAEQEKSQEKKSSITKEFLMKYGF